MSYICFMGHTKKCKPTGYVLIEYCSFSRWNSKNKFQLMSVCLKFIRCKYIYFMKIKTNYSPIKKHTRSPSKLWLLPTTIMRGFYAITILNKLFWDWKGVILYYNTGFMHSWSWDTPYTVTFMHIKMKCFFTSNTSLRFP